MQRAGVVDFIQKHARVLIDPAALPTWLDTEYFLRFLRNSVCGCIPLYVSTDCLYLYSILLPEALLDALNVLDLLEWDVGPTSGCWDYSYGRLGENGVGFAIEPPLSGVRPEVLRQGYPIYCLREFHGVGSYVELDQRIAHTMGIHFVQERNAYCRLHETGDYQEIAITRREDGQIVATMDEGALNAFMLLTGTVVIRFFRWERFIDVYGTDSEHEDEVVSDPTEQVHFRYRRYGPEDQPLGASWTGLQVVRRGRPNSETAAILTGQVPKEYASFIVSDWKHRRIIEWTSDPTRLGNYFVPSDLPLETSIAFFRPEVLAKYKADPDRYPMQPGRVSCRGGWSLKFHVNKAGQIHVYLYDLGTLPHSEQLHWKSFNEEPEAGISERAFKTDFLADWDDTYDPLVSLFQFCQKEFPTALLQSGRVTIWQTDNQVARRLAPVYTESHKEWEDAVLVLAKLIVDGLSKDALRKIAMCLDCDDPKLGSLKLLERCLQCVDIDSAVVQEIVGPMFTLWDLRSTGGVAHRGTATVTNTREHYVELVTACDKAMRHLAELISARVFDYSVDGQ